MQQKILSERIDENGEIRVAKVTRHERCSPHFVMLFLIEHEKEGEKRRHINDDKK